MELPEAEESRLLRSALEDFLALERPKSKVAVEAIFEEFGSLGDALAATPTRLAKVIGAGPAKRLLKFKVLAQAVLSERVRTRPWLPLEEMASVANYEIGYAPVERAFVFFIDASGRVIRSEVVSEGNPTGTLVDMRGLIIRAVEHGACSLLLVHNHPSGILQPSDTDLALTSRLKRMSHEFDLRLIDHVIVGRGRAYSIEQRRLFRCELTEQTFFANSAARRSPR